MMAIPLNPELSREDVDSFDHDEEKLESTELGSALLRETLRNALSNHGLVLDEQTPLAQALREMREHRQGCVLAAHRGERDGPRLRRRRPGQRLVQARRSGGALTTTSLDSTTSARKPPACVAARSAG